MAGNRERAQFLSGNTLTLLRLQGKYTRSVCIYGRQLIARSEKFPLGIFSYGKGRSNECGEI